MDACTLESVMNENFDQAVKRSWDRKGQLIPSNRGVHWLMVHHDKLLVRQMYMMREGRHSLHNMIRGDHGLSNRY